MSYKLHNCGIPEKNGVNGIVSGVFEECAISADDKAVYISRGKMLIAGYEIEIDGREVVGIPSDWKSGVLYLIGTLAVSDGVGENFHFSLRSTNSLVQNDVYGKGYGTYEVLIGEVVNAYGFWGAKSTLKVLVDKMDEKRGSNANSVSVEGERIVIDDAENGYLKNVRLLGNMAIDDKNEIVGVPAVFKITSSSKNLYDYATAKILQEGEEKTGNYVYGERITGEIKRIQNGYRAKGWRNPDADFFSNGYIEMSLGYLEAGDYRIGFDVFVNEVWGNEGARCFFEAVQGTENNGYLMRAYTEGVEQRDNDCFFTILKPGYTQFRIHLLGHDVSIRNIQCEKGNIPSSYSEYFNSEVGIEIKDVNGVRHTLYSVGDTHDEVYCDGGSYKLIKRVKFKMGGVTGDSKPYSHYFNMQTRETNQTGNTTDIVLAEPIMIAYTTLTPEIYELDSELMHNLERIPVGDGIITVEGDSQQKAIIYAEYEQSLAKVVKELEKKVDELTTRLSAL